MTFVNPQNSVSPSSDTVISGEIPAANRITVLYPDWGKPYKRFRKGEEKSEKPDFGGFHLVESLPCKTLEDIEKIIQPPEDHPCHGANRYVIKGEFVGATEAAKLEKHHKATWEPKKSGEKRKAHIRRQVEPGETLYRRNQELFPDVPRAWAVFDIDEAPIEDGGLFDVNDPVPQIRAYLTRIGGEAFANCDILWSLSSSAGTGLKEGINCHVWVMLSRPVSCAEWKAWAQSKAGFDTSLFSSEHVVFFMPPKFEDGATDPLEGKPRLGIDRGEGALDVAKLAIPEVAEAPPKAAKRTAPRLAGGRPAPGDKDDPRNHTNPIHAAFCRAFSVEEAFQFIPDEKFSVDGPGTDGATRVSWGLRKTEGGCWITPDGLRISGEYEKWPKTDNDKGQMLDAFEMVAFFDVFEKPNTGHAETSKWAATLPEVQAELEAADQPDPYDEDGGDEEAAAMRLEYPIPNGVEDPPDWKNGWKAKYVKDGNAWWLERSREKKKADQTPGEPATERERLWSPITFSGLSERHGEKGGMKTRIKLRGPRGRVVHLAIERKVAVDKTLIATLLGEGWASGGSKSEALMVNVFKAQQGLHTITELPQRGFTKDPTAFAGVSGDVVGKDAAEYVLDESLVAENPKAGSFEGWQADIDAILAIENMPHWHAGVAMGFVGNLAGYVGENPALWLWGTTSTGKTITQKVAAAVWGPERGAGSLLHSLGQTKNNLENISQLGNCMFVGMDETNAMDDPKVLATFAYKNAMGETKGRALPGGGSRDQKYWKTFTVISSETSMPDWITTHGPPNQPMYGAHYRMPSVRITGTALLPDPVVKGVEARLKRNHGFAGERFAEKLMATYTPEQVRRAHLAACGEFGAPDGAAARGSASFGWMLLAARYAAEFGIITKANEALVVVGVKWMWEQSDVRVSPVERAMEKLEEYIRKHWDSGIVSWEHGRGGFQGALGYYTDKYVLFDRKQFAVACGGGGVEDAVLTALQGAKELRVNDGKTGYKMKSGPRFVAIHRYVDFDAKEPKEPTRFGRVGLGDEVKVAPATPQIIDAGAGGKVVPITKGLNIKAPGEAHFDDVPEGRTLN